jgi:triosephosphate isomerase (TIM)
MARQPIIAGNWKLNKGTKEEASALATEVASAVSGASAQVVVCVPFTVLSAVSEALAGSVVGLGAQNCFWKESGAYTGQVAPSMLRGVGCTHVILGHSETRGRYGVPEPDFTPEVLAHFGESDATVSKKTKTALAAGLIPIVCVGETLAERESGETDAVVSSQVTGALTGFSPAEVAGLVLAYEPVWAIGTGKTCDATEANRVCGVVRAAVSQLVGEESAQAVRIQYGGSMKPDNAAELLAMEHIDGGLIGGASLKAGDFASIVLAAK